MRSVLHAGYWESRLLAGVIAAGVVAGCEAGHQDTLASADVAALSADTLEASEDASGDPRTPGDASGPADGGDDPAPVDIQAFADDTAELPEVAPSEPAPVVLPPCLAPSFPQMDRYPPGSPLTFSAPEGCEVAWSAVDAEEPTAWSAGPTLQLPEQPGPIRVYARTLGCDPAASTTRAVVELAEAFAPNGEGAVGLDDVAISGWAAEVRSVTYGTGVDETWRRPEEALGPAGLDPLDALVLGNGGQATVVFDPPIRDVEGPDLAVFENGNGQFLELGFVEVSSDGEHFVRFASRYLGSKPVSAYGVHASELMGGLAGKYSLGSGTPFDLAWLRSEPWVQAGAVDLAAIRYVRVLDIVGDGLTLDSFGGPIYDPTPTFGSGGFDLDAICSLGQ